MKFWVRIYCHHPGETASVTVILSTDWCEIFMRRDALPYVNQGNHYVNQGNHWTSSFLHSPTDSWDKGRRFFHSNFLKPSNASRNYQRATLSNAAPLHGSLFSRNEASVIQPPPTRTITVELRNRTRYSLPFSPNWTPQQHSSSQSQQSKTKFNSNFYSNLIQSCTYDKQSMEYPYVVCNKWSK